jgi:type IV fimbrial biogenesis protein FimT
MLKTRPSQRGFNLIEILVTLSVLGVLLALGAPSLAEFLQNQQIRAATEAIVNGMQVARGEAIRRNLAVQLVLEPPTSGWTICEATVEPCDSTTSLTADPPLVIQSRSPDEGTSGTNIAQTPNDTVAVTFSPLGSVLPTNFNASPPITRVDVIKPLPNLCIADGGSMRCLRVVVTGGGSIRMCDPTPGIVAPDPRACP